MKKDFLVSVLWFGTACYAFFIGREIERNHQKQEVAPEPKKDAVYAHDSSLSGGDAAVMLLASGEKRKLDLIGRPTGNVHVVDTATTEGFLLYLPAGVETDLSKDQTGVTFTRDHRKFLVLVRTNQDGTEYDWLLGLCYLDKEGKWGKLVDPHSSEGRLTREHLQKMLDVL